MTHAERNSATPNDSSKMLRVSPRLAEFAPPSCFSFRLLFRQLAEPTQSDRNLAIIYLVPATKSPDSHSIEPGSLDRTSDIVLLLYCRNSVILTGADVNRRAQKIRARLDPGVSIAQVVFVRAGHVDTNDATAIPRE